MNKPTKPTPEQAKEFARVVSLKHNMTVPDQLWDDHNHSIAQACLPFVEMYINGLITDYDFLVVMHNHANAKKIPNIGEFDRNTGLRYTPEQVMRYAGISGKVGFDDYE